MIAFEEVTAQQKYDLVLVIEDVTSTMACALVAVKLQIPVSHVEAGIRVLTEPCQKKLTVLSQI